MYVYTGPLPCGCGVYIGLPIVTTNITNRAIASLYSRDRACAGWPVCVCACLRVFAHVESR